MTTNSARTFAVVYLTGMFTYSNPAILLDEIIGAQNDGRDYEHFYAMQDRIDEILDLKPGETLGMTFSRDDKACVGYIRRVR